MRAPAAAALALLLAGGSAPGAPAGEPRPFPVDRTVILKEEKAVYIVEGRVTIPRGVEVTCQKDVTIRAPGGGTGTIVVEGSLVIRGVARGEVVMEGVTVEPAGTFTDIHLDTCRMTGGGVVTGRERPATGMLTVENCTLQGGARIEVEMTGGKAKVFSVLAGSPTLIRGVDREGTVNRLFSNVWTSEFAGFTAENVSDLTLRSNLLKGERVLLRDNPVLVLDGNRVEAPELRIEQSAAGRFSRTTVTKCDLLSTALVFRAPADPKRNDTLVLDKCWFEGRTDPKEIAERIRDAADDPENNVRVAVVKPMKRPLDLARPPGPPR